MRPTVHVGGGGARGHRLPRGAGAERAAAVPGGGGAAGRAGVGAVQAERAAPLQARRAGTAPPPARCECFLRTACLPRPSTALNLAANRCAIVLQS